MKAIIVDDELLARERVLSLLNKVEGIEVIKECSNGKAAISAVNELNPDLLFLDIDMKDMTGFQVLENIEVSPKPVVVFITAHDQYALKAFDFEAFDFLLKPFKEERFFRTIEKVMQVPAKETGKDFESKLKHLLSLYQPNAGPVMNKQKMLVKQRNKTLLVDIPEIKYIIADGYYVEIFTDDKKFVIREPLSRLIDTLGSAFIRIHRSTIINSAFIREILHSNYSEIDVKMKDDKVLSVSKSYRKEFMNRLGM